MVILTDKKTYNLDVKSVEVKESTQWSQFGLLTWYNVIVNDDLNIFYSGYASEANEVKNKIEQALINNEASLDLT